jgi:hypothetical protein
MGMERPDEPVDRIVICTSADDTFASTLGGCKKVTSAMRWEDQPRIALDNFARGPVQSRDQFRNSRRHVPRMVKELDL